MEVNSSLGLEGIESATGLDIGNSIVKAVEKQLKDRNTHSDIKYNLQTV